MKDAIRKRVLQLVEVPRLPCILAETIGNTTHDSVWCDGPDTPWAILENFFIFILRRRSRRDIFHVDSCCRLRPFWNHPVISNPLRGIAVAVRPRENMWL